jgi:hypothetical protein
MQEEIFGFVQCVVPTKQEPVLLLTDGHSSHTKDIGVLDTVHGNGFVMFFCVLPRCKHKFQLPDVAFMRPLVKYNRKVKT